MMADTEKIPEGWRLASLEELVKIQSGFPFKSNDLKGRVRYVVKIGNITKDGVLLDENSMTDVGIEIISSRYIANDGDILMSLTGGDVSNLDTAVGRVAVYSGKDPIFVNQRVGNIIPNSNIDKRFLFHFLRQSEITVHLATVANGSAQKNLTNGQIYGLKLPLPPILEQRDISDVLSSFDDKIELLRKQNKTLEKTAQAIYHERFGRYSVDDELPEGWKIHSLDELVESVSGYAYSGSELVENSKDALVTLKSFDRNGGFQTRGFKPFLGTPKSSQEVFIGDVAVAHTDLAQDAEVLGNPAIITSRGGFERMFITMDLVKVSSKREGLGSAFLYFLMKTRAFKGHCVGYSNGTTVLHLSKKAIPEFKVALPENLEELSGMSGFFTDTLKRISAIENELVALAEVRDRLLPRLMSGEIILRQ